MSENSMFGDQPRSQNERDFYKDRPKDNAQAIITEWWPIKGPIYRTNSQISTLRANYTLLQTGEVEGVAAADHTRGVMQFSLAADRMLGSFFDPEGLEEEGLIPRPNTQRGGRDNMRGGFGM
jgi:hypothetical protein